MGVPEDGQPQAIRILVANLAAKLAQIVIDTVSAQPDMALLGTVQGQMEILVEIERLKPVEILLLGSNTGFPPTGLCSHLLDQFPQLRILLIGASDEVVWAYWLGLYAKTLHLIEAETLASDIRYIANLNTTSHQSVKE